VHRGPHEPAKLCHPTEYAIWIFSLSKQFTIHEGVLLQVRAEACNAPNYPDLASGDGGFGIVGSHLNNYRRMRFGARFQFQGLNALSPRGSSRSRRPELHEGSGVKRICASLVLVSRNPVW
jgi:hypothetical protein